MKDIDISNYSDEELIQKFSVQSNGRRFINARIWKAIGERRAKLANRKPGAPGTTENPIFKNGHAYVYDSQNRLIMWEDFDGPIPSEEVKYPVDFDPETMEIYTLPRDAKATPEQSRMVRDAQSRPPVYDEDCPAPSKETLERMRRFVEMRHKQVSM